ncbi:MAG TPA: DNA-binding protein [Propionibacteriaceae bacterium]|nr:DNA-binding protein [Propionibacteriaceae bacterium]
MTIKPVRTEAECRATEAAEQLAAEGKPVTNRTVRERAGVAMAVAAEAARVWNETAARAAAVPEIPDVVRARLNGVWREAYVAAREEFSTERGALAGKLRVVEDENQSLTKDLTEAEARIDQIQVERDAEQQQARREREQLSARVAELESQYDAATKALSAAEGVAAGLREALTTIKSAKR